MNETEDEFKAALIRGWIADKGTQYLHLGKNHMLLEASGEALNSQGQTTAFVMPYGTSRTRTKVQVKAQVNYAHIVVFFINLVNAQLKRQSVTFVKQLVIMQKFAEVNTEK